MSYDAFNGFAWGSEIILLSYDVAAPWAAGGGWSLLTPTLSSCAVLLGTGMLCLICK